MEQDVRETAVLAAGQLRQTLGELHQEQLDRLMQAIQEGDHIFFAAAGRSMLMLRCMAMRLMQLGFQCYIVGDTTTPAFQKGDLLITASGSGETAYTIAVAEKAKKIGGMVAAITIRRESVLGKLADLIVEVDARSDKVDDSGQKQTVLPGGSLFEQSILFIGDAMVVPLSGKNGIPLDRAFQRHANLE